MSRSIAELIGFSPGERRDAELAETKEQVQHALISFQRPDGTSASMAAAMGGHVAPLAASPGAAAGPSGATKGIFDPFAFLTTAPEPVGSAVRDAPPHHAGPVPFRDAEETEERRQERIREREERDRQEAVARIMRAGLLRNAFSTALPVEAAVAPTAQPGAGLETDDHDEEDEDDIGIDFDPR